MRGAKTKTTKQKTENKKQSSAKEMIVKIKQKY